MPLITREGKGSKLSISEMDGNLLYLESLATTTHEALTDKNSEAAFQHVDTTVTKPTLDPTDMVAIKDSVTGNIVLTPKSNLQTAVVQNTGTSETDVMSQNAVTNAIDNLAIETVIDMKPGEYLSDIIHK